jgi:hypothetical protein
LSLCFGKPRSVGSIVTVSCAYRGMMREAVTARESFQAIGAFI